MSSHRRYKCFVLYCLLFISFLTVIYYLFINVRLTDISLITTFDTSQTSRSNNARLVKEASKCIPYTVPDNRSFFEREPPQLNLPRRISNLSDQDIFQQLRSLRLNILSTARNVEHRIDKFRKRVEPIVNLFHPSSRILICESDSTDHTVEKLYQWPYVQVYRYGNLTANYSERTDRIAFCRNKLLDLAHEMKSDYLLIVDLDIFASNIQAFISNFRYNIDDWSVMTASARGSYYDIWALRTLSDSVLNFDVWHRIWDIGKKQKQFCAKSVVDQIIGNNQKEIPIDHNLIEVRSAFHGAGLYKTKITYGCKYSGADSTCEHVPFHLCLREKNQGRIFINPAFLLT